MISWEDDRDNSMRLDVGKAGFALLVRRSNGGAEYWIDSTREQYERVNEIEVVSPVFDCQEYAARWFHKSIDTILNNEREKGYIATYSNGAGSWKMEFYARNRAANLAKRAAKKAAKKAAK